MPPLFLWKFASKLPPHIKHLGMRILNSLGYWPRRIQTGPAHGLVIYVNFERSTYLDASYEPHVLAALSQCIQPGMVALDIGAHLGYYTLAMACQSGAAGHIYAFEPFPRHISSLQRTLKKNHLTQVTLIPKAIGAQNGMATLEAWPNDAMHRIISNDHTTWPFPKLSVPITSLDDWTRDENLTRLDFIKLDIEGLELAALQGGVHLLKRFRPLILCEIHRRADVPYQPHQLVEWLQEKDYHVHLIPSPIYPLDSLAQTLQRLETGDVPLGVMKVCHILAKPD